jgi:signal peptidase I
MQVAGDACVRCGGADFEELAVYLLQGGHALRFRARGSSMYPVVRDGDTLDVWPARSAEVDVGDIVLYRSSRSGIVVHRVVDIRRQEEKTILLVKGDSAARADPQVEESQVLGRVESIHRRGHTIVPTSWTSRHVAPLHARLFRLRRWAYRLLKQAHSGLRKVVAAVGSGA